MRPASPPTEADQVTLPKKVFLTAEEFDELWDARGLKFGVDDLHLAMLSRGLAPHVDRQSFRSTVRGLLTTFLVNGESRLDPKKSPIPKFPKVF